MINAQYFTNPNALMPVPKLTFHNSNSYWNYWYVLGNNTVNTFNRLLRTIPSGSLVLFDDRFCRQIQYAIFMEYDSDSHKAYFQLLNDQLQFINATASLIWTTNQPNWCLRIQSACLCLSTDTPSRRNADLTLHNYKIQDGVLGEYTKPIE